MQHSKSWILPIAIVLSVFFHEYIVVLNPSLPYLLILLLYFSFNSLDVKTMRCKMFDLWLLLFQLVFSTSVYLLIKPFNEVVAQGAFVIVLAPTASAAIAVSLILGANISMITTYLLVCNIMVAVVAPLAFTIIGFSSDFSFWSSFIIIFRKVFPLLILPLFMALFTNRFWPKVNKYIIEHKNLSFYVWAICLTIVLSKAVSLLITQFKEHRVMFLCMVLVSLILCIIQFAIGRFIGSHYGDKIAGGQALGQKNTVLAIWMAQNYLNPLSSIVPTIYILWHNLYNSIQMMQNSKFEKKTIIDK